MFVAFAAATFLQLPVPALQLQLQLLFSAFAAAISVVKWPPARLRRLCDLRKWKMEKFCTNGKIWKLYVKKLTIYVKKLTMYVKKLTIFLLKN